MIVATGQKAPSFELPVLDLNGEQLGRLQEGDSCRLEDLLEEGPCLLLFVKKSCVTCLYTLPFIDRLYRSYLQCSARIVVVAQEDRETARELVRKLDFKMPVLLDIPPHPVSARYGLEFVPDGFFIEQDGTVEVLFECFSRPAIEEVNQRFADLCQLTPANIFPEGEEIPPWRPG